MGIGSGVVAQIGFVQETTPGTVVTPTKFYEFDSESVALKKKTVQGGGWRPDKTVDRESRRYAVQRTADGDITLEVPIKSFGFLLANMLGSFATVPVQQGATTAYKQIHVPGPFTGKTMTMQKGVPGANGTVVPFTYPGAVITAWEMSCAQSDLLKAKLTIDAWDELTPNSTPAGPALATASYPAALGNFVFTQGALLAGGTVATASGLATLTGGTAVASVTAATFSSTNPRADSRFFMGQATKAEQIQNAYTTINGQIDAEFFSTTLYDLYRSDGPTAIQLTFTSTLLAGTAFPFSLQILIPVGNLDDSASPTVGGPDVVSISAPFTGLDDGVNAPIQVVYMSTDVTI